MTTERVPLPLDHIGWLVSDLKLARAELLSLGFAVTSPGTLKTGSAADPAADVGQQSAHVMFGDTYLELTHVAAGARPAHLAPYLGQEGLLILALRVEAATAAREQLARAGIAVTPAAHSERPLDYPPPARRGTARFHWFMCSAEEYPEALVCCVEHATPELVFQPAVSDHDLSVVRLRSVFLLASDPAAAAARYQPLTGLAPGGVAHGELVILDPATAGERFTGLDLAAGPRPLGIGLEVKDLATVARRLREADAAPVQQGGRLWCRGPADTVLEFSP